MKVDISRLRKKIKELFNIKWLPAAALVLGLMILFLPKMEKTSPEQYQKEDSQPEFSLEREERRIAEALRSISGAEDVSVTLTLECGVEQEIARDEKTQYDESGNERESTVVKMQNGSSRQEPVTLKYNYPEYRGAFVAVKGAGADLRLKITQAIAALTGLTTDRITVLAGR